MMNHSFSGAEPNDHIKELLIKRSHKNDYTGGCSMKEPWVEIKLEVPLSAIDFSDCGDGCGLIHGLDKARFGGYPVADFDDAVLATAEMHRQMGDTERATEFFYQREVERQNAENRAQFLAMIEREREAALNDPLAAARAQR
jgi:hypothetical protein